MSRKKQLHDFSAMKVVDRPTQTYKWTDRDLLNLTAALQCYGFSETKKIAELIGTKDENAVKFYLENEIGKLNQRFYGERSFKYIAENHTWFHPHSAELKTWPAVRKWRRLMYNQLIPELKRHEYSKVIMEDLLQAFYEEAEESNDNQVINVKAVYKYLLDCVRGYVPAELPPIESGIVLLLLGQLNEMQRDLDFDEELGFLRTFKSARKFKPLKIKKEFKERRKNYSKADMSKNAPEPPELKNHIESDMEQDIPESSESKVNMESEMEQDPPESSEPKINMGVEESTNSDDSEAIEVAEEMYLYLTKHKKLVQSMNPMNVPLWTLVKEQAYVQNKCELSSRMDYLQRSNFKS